jgi:hypothetical protein
MQIRLIVLPTIYISLLLLTAFLYFMKNEWASKYKKVLINVHLVLFLLIILNLSVFNLRGVWLERIIVITFLLTGAGIFALYRKTLNLWKKIYFGFFLFYPLIAPITFFIDRIMFVLALSPFILTMLIPETKLSSQDFEIRSPIGLISPLRLQLIQKGLITETSLGICNNEDVVLLDISGIKITSQESDSTQAIIFSNGKEYPATFYK